MYIYLIQNNLYHRKLKGGRSYSGLMNNFILLFLVFVVHMLHFMFSLYKKYYVKKSNNYVGVAKYNWIVVLAPPQDISRLRPCTVTS